ncbi:APC family permease [Acidobacteriota bacterium]
MTSQNLEKGIKLRHYFVLGFGCIVGVGWVVVLGEMFEQAGPLGTILGFAGGGSLMIIVGLCYGEMATMFPVAGGEIAYTYEIYGVKTSFLVGWFLTLCFTIFIAFEAISAGWLFGEMVPGLKGPFLYTSGGDPVHLGTLAFGLIGTLLLTYLNFRGIKSAVIFQEIFTYGLIILSLIFIIAGIFWGKTSNMTPLFAKTETWPIIGGIAAVFVMAPIFIAGFNVIPQTMEEKAEKTSMRLVGQVIVLSIVGAVIFYLLVFLSASMSTPWQDIVGLELPAAGAFEAAFNSPLMAKIVLFAAFCGILSTWNTVFITASRAFFALGRARIIPTKFGAVHNAHGSPYFAILFAGSIAFLATFLGRSAIVPIINVGVSCVTFAFFLICLGLIKLRRQRPDAHRPYRTPGGKVTAAFGSVISLFVFGLSLYQPYSSSEGRFPLEWGIILGWSIVGIAFWIGARKIRSSISEQERRRLILGRSTPSTE